MRLPGMAVQVLCAPSVHSPKRNLSSADLSRYLDYCSEMLSITGKIENGIWRSDDLALMAKGFAARGVGSVDLGGRMHAAVAESSAAGTLVIGTLVIGTDCPALTPDVLREAAAALREHDAVVIPAEDGGYVLIGLRQPVHAVFQHVEWSTDRVMAQTRQQLQMAGLTWRELAPLWDVDRFEDVGRVLGLFPDVAAVVLPTGGGV